MPSIRQQKVAAQIKRIVATVLQREVGDPRIDGLVSVTKVEISPDLREAKVYLSVLGSRRPAATVLQGIKSAGRHIQGEVAENLPLRFAPRLSFQLDESLKKQAEILKTIDDVMGGRGENPRTTSAGPSLRPSGAGETDDEDT